MDLKIDTVIVIDSWWNIPNEIVQKILNIECNEIFCNNTFSRSIHKKLKHLEVKNDLENFIKNCVTFKRNNNRPKNVLLVGQAWDCGIHYETLGVDNLIKFIGVLNLFVNPDYIVLDTTKFIDRTCTDYHIKNYKYKWIRKENNYYECQKENSI